MGGAVDKWWEKSCSGLMGGCRHWRNLGAAMSTTYGAGVCWLGAGWRPWLDEHWGGRDGATPCVLLLRW